MEHRERRRGDPGSRIEAEAESEQLLGIYKLHAELADHVSQRREGANRLYIGLFSGLLVLLAALLRFGVGDALDPRIAIAIAGLGILFVVCLSLSWWSVLQTYRQLNGRKFEMLHDLEKRLPYDPFTREWKSQRKYWRLTHAEKSLPLLFCLVSVALLAVVIWSIYSEA